MAQLLEELAGDTDDLVDGLHHVDGDADGAGLVGDGPGDGLADPPGGIGGELVALGVVELLHRLDEAQVALLNQIQKEHAAAHIPLGDGHHQAEVGLGQALLGGLAPLHQAAQFLLLLLGEGDFLAVFPGLLQLLHLLLGRVAGPHILGQLDLLIGSEQIHLADLLEVHPHRVVDAEGVHQRIGIHHLLLGELLNLVELLQGGHDIIGQLGQIVVAHGVDAQVLQGIVDLVHLVALQIQVLQHIHELTGRELAVFLAPLDQLRQLFRPLDALDDLHDLDLALLHLLHIGLGQLGLILQGQGVYLLAGGLLFTHAVILHTLFFL